MNSLPRWLISMIDMPVPRQSSISSPARASTSAGSIAGPALKLKIRDMIPENENSVNRGRRLGRRVVRRSFTIALCAAWFGVAAAVAAVAVDDVALLDALHAGELLAFAERDQRHAL